MMDQPELFESEGNFLARMRHNWGKAIEGEGAYCPCCGKWGKVYKIKLSQHLALCLRWIITHLDSEGWVDVQNTAPRWMLKSKTYPLLEHWALIESKATRSGIWTATAKGHNFASGDITLPAAVYIYDNKAWGFEEEQTTFRNCFGKHFDFDEMMSAQFNWAKLSTERNKND